MPLEFRFPDIGEGTDSGELLEWHVVEGQQVREDDPLAEVETDKARVTIPCPTTGRVLELRGQVGDRLPVGEVMAIFEADADATGAARPPAPAAASAPDAPPPQGPARADQVIPLRGVRRTIARTMTESWQTIPHIIDYREADATGLLAWRNRARERAGTERLTITPLLLQIAVDALRRHPYVNASIDLEREEITLHAAYNIGIATATPDGLIVPVVPDADGKSVSELAVEVNELARAARERRLRPEQLTGGTFTLNNYGALGGWLGTPIIKPGEVAILGVGRVQERPVALDGQVVVRPIMALAVSGDHRVLDGQTLGAFVSDVVALIEDPAALAG